MPKCCAYGIPNDPEGDVVRFTLCTADGEPCPQFAAWRSLGSWQVESCADCKAPEVKPALKCCAYGIPNDPEGDVIRWTLCTPADQPCPKFAAYKSLGSWAVAECEDCAPPPQLAPAPDLRDLIRRIERLILVLERLPGLAPPGPFPPPGPGPKRPAKAAQKRAARRTPR